MLKKRFRAPRGGLHVIGNAQKKRTEGVSNRFFFLNPTPMKISRLVDYLARYTVASGGHFAT